MAIGSYPRVTVQGTSNAQNPQNGYGLMIFNSTTGKYEAATAATFGGGGGGGDATAANQTTQIGLENTIAVRLLDGTSGFTAAELLSSIANLLNATNTLITGSNTDLGKILNELVALNSSIVNGSQRVVIQDTAGTTVKVDSDTEALLVKTTA